MIQENDSNEMCAGSLFTFTVDDSRQEMGEL